MTKHAIRPSIAKVQNAQKMFTSTKTNATIRDLEEEEGELEEKKGIVVSINRDNINGEGWTVKDSKGQIYKCSCASSMYEIPETVERGGTLIPTETIEVVFTVNPILRINTIKEIKSLGSETEKLDVSKWQHGNESTTVIAKPKSALTVSDGFIKMDYNNDNKVLANNDEVKTKGKKTNIATERLSINSKNIDIGGIELQDFIDDSALNISNEFTSFDVESPISTIIDRTNNMTQLHLSGTITGNKVIGQIKDQKSIPVRTQSQLITDGNCIDKVIIDTNGIIQIESINHCTEERTIDSTHSWITPQVQSRNYIKVTVKETCNNCDEGMNNEMEYINYCPSCQSWNTLVDTGTSIRCSACKKQNQYCQNCGINLENSNLRLKKYLDNNIIVMGTTCKYCSAQLNSDTSQEFVHYCPECKEWGTLYHSELIENGEIISILKCSHCDDEYCATCGISQNKHGLTLNGQSDVTIQEYNQAFRKLKYINGA